MNKQNKINQINNNKSQKININLDNWLNISAHIIKEHKQVFSLWQRLKNWKKPFNTTTRIAKEIIKQLDQRKINFDNALFLCRSIEEKVKPLQNQIPKLLLINLIILILLISSIIIAIINIPKPFLLNNITHEHYIFFIWLISSISISVILFNSWRKYKNTENNLLKYIFLVQGSAAYAAAKAPGKGGSIKEAYLELEKMQKLQNNKLLK